MTELQLLHHLLDGHAVPSDEQTDRLLNALKQRGCELNVTPRGSMLQRTDLSVWKDSLEDKFGANRSFQVYASTKSTQDLAIKLAREPSARTGSVVVAGYQSAGRGRQGKAWWASQDGSLTFSYLLAMPPQHDLLAPAASAAICTALDPLLQQLNLQTSVKWPNDIYVKRTKIAGVLIETVGRFAIIGIGINVSESPRLPPDSHHYATTDLVQLGVHRDRLAVLHAVIRELNHVFQPINEQQLLSLWKRKLLAYDQPIMLKVKSKTMRGRIIDVDEQWSMTIDLGSGQTRTIAASHASLGTP